MKISCLTRCMGNSIGSLKIKDWFFGWAHLIPIVISNSQEFREATKISILSNDQTRHLFKVLVGSMIYSTSCSHETIDLNLGCAWMRLNSLLSEDVWDVENFTITIQLFGIVWTTISKSSSRCCLPTTSHVDIVLIISLFSFIPWRHILLSYSQPWYGSDHCELELHGWVTGRAFAPSHSHWFVFDDKIS